MRFSGIPAQDAKTTVGETYLGAAPFDRAELHVARSRGDHALLGDERSGERKQESPRVGFQEHRGLHVTSTAADLMSHLVEHRLQARVIFGQGCGGHPAQVLAGVDLQPEVASRVDERPSAAQCLGDRVRHRERAASSQSR